MLSLLAISHNTIGMSAALVAALFWALATVLYRRVGRVLPPVRLNFIKGLISIPLFAAVTLWIGWRHGENPLVMPSGLMALLLLSGVVGLGVGDTFFFAALNRLGSRRTLLLFMLAPVITALVAYPALGESLATMQWLGIAITCGGICWVIAERAHAKDDGHLDRLGLFFGVMAAACQSCGALMTRYVFEHSEIAPMPSSLIRMLGGCAILLLMLPLDRKLSDAGGEEHNHPARPSRAKFVMMLGFAMLFGTFFGIWLQQISIEQTHRIGISATLLSISPLFVLPIALVMRERVSRRAILGAAVSVVGVAILFGVI